MMLDGCIVDYHHVVVTMLFVWAHEDTDHKIHRKLKQTPWPSRMYVI